MSSQKNMAAGKAANQNTVNGLNLDQLGEIVAAIDQDPANGVMKFHVGTAWQGQTRSRATVKGYTLGGNWIKRRFTIDADEPSEVLGSNSAPNPQELLMAAINACMVVGYVAGAATRGITLTRLEIDSEGEIDARGFLGNPEVPAGYRALHIRVVIAGNGSAEDFRAIHADVMKTSPNVFNITQPVSVSAELSVAA